MSALRLAVGLTHTWVRLYTRGLPPKPREARRAELESDLWEHVNEREHRPAATALEIAVRLLAGVPADLSWRLEHRSRKRRPARLVEGSRAMIAAVKRNGMIVLSGLLGAYYLAMGITVPLGGDWGSTGELAAYGAMVGLGGVLVFAGLWASGRAPRLAGVSLAVGAALGAAMTFWLIVTPALALLVIVWVVMRRRGHTPAPA